MLTNSSPTMLPFLFRNALQGLCATLLFSCAGNDHAEREALKQEEQRLEREHASRRRALEADLNSRRTPGFIEEGDGALRGLTPEGSTGIGRACPREAKGAVHFVATIDGAGKAKAVELVETSGFDTCDAAIRDALSRGSWQPCTEHKGGDCLVKGVLGLPSPFHRVPTSQQR